MERFRNRPLDGQYPYVPLDAKPVRVRYDGRVVHKAAAVAIGVRQDRSREVLGFNVGGQRDLRDLRRSSCGSSWGRDCEGYGW